MLASGLERNVERRGVITESLAFSLQLGGEPEEKEQVRSMLRSLSWDPNPWDPQGELDSKRERKEENDDKGHKDKKSSG